MSIPRPVYQIDFHPHFDRCTALHHSAQSENDFFQQNGGRDRYGGSSLCITLASGGSVPLNAGPNLQNQCELFLALSFVACMVVMIWKTTLSASNLMQRIHVCCFFRRAGDLLSPLARIIQS